MFSLDGSPLTLLGPPPGQLYLHAMSGREELGRPFEYELELFTDLPDFAARSILGKPLTARLATDAGERLWNGVVTRVARGADRDHFAAYHAVLAPRLWLLTKTADCRIYQGMTIPEVITAVLREHAVPFVDRLTPGAYQPVDYLTQYRESDFAFLSRIMEQEGIYYYFRHSVDKHEVVLADSLASHDPRPGYERLLLRPAMGVRSLHEQLTDWRPVERAGSARVTLQDHDFRLRAGSDIRAVKAVPAENEEDGWEIYDYPGDHVVAANKDDGDAGANRQAGDQQATVRLQEQRSSLARFEGAGNARGVEVGAVFQLDSLATVGKNFLVTRTDINVRNDPRDGAADPEHEVCQLALEAMDGQRPFRPARATARPVIAGPQTATVVGPAGEEIFTDKHARIKVQFHWDREGKLDQDSSCWVRVAQIWAGSSWGAIAIPRIGQEVIVQFLEGNPDRPIVTGSVYNVDQPPPHPLPDGATRSGIRTRSTKGGGPDDFNELRFEDKKGSEELHLQAQKDMSTLVKNDQTTTVQANRTVSVGANESHSVTGTRSLSVTGNDTQSFAANRTVSVTGTDTHAITGARTETYEGGRSRDVKAFDNTTVNGANKVTTVHGEYNITADAQYQVQQAGNQVLVKDKVLVTSTANVEVNNPSCTLKFEGGKATITAASEISFQCGTASITLRSDGSINIDAPSTVTASSGKSGLELVPGGATISATKATVNADTLTEIVGGIVKIN